MNMWGGIFTEPPSALAHAFNSSIAFDKRLYKHDIRGSIAHAEMLGKCGIISQSDSGAIVAELEQILADISGGTLKIDESCEDIHTFIENELVARIGEVGKRLHTARSRNDQVALSLRMYCREQNREIWKLLNALLDILDELAVVHADTIMPGYTHLQKAQPVTLGLYIGAYREMFLRDCVSLDNACADNNSMPLGSGALAGTAFPIDREYVRKKLEFRCVTRNSLDAVSDRDFVLELLFVISTIMLHLSRFCEELILWATQEFGYVTIAEAYSTGSSIMPQKKNPDTLELIRGKSGRVFGNLSGFFATVKSLPLTYNKDMQECHEALYDSVDTVKPCLYLFAEVLKTASFHTERMYESATAVGGYMNATYAADYLARKGIPFRDAHEIVGKLVNYSITHNKRLEDMTLGEFQRFSDKFEADVFDAISITRSNICS